MCTYLSLLIYIHICTYVRIYIYMITVRVCVCEDCMCLECSLPDFQLTESMILSCLAREIWACQRVGRLGGVSIPQDPPLPCGIFPSCIYSVSTTTPIQNTVCLACWLDSQPLPFYITCLSPGPSSAYISIYLSIFLL